MSRQIFVPSALSDLVAAIKARAVPGTGVTVWDRALGGQRLTDLYTVGTGDLPSLPIPNGVLTASVSGVLPTFMGPDEVSTVYVEYKGGSARQLLGAIRPSAQGDTGALQPATTYAYNGDGTIASETTGSVVTTYGYSGGQLATITRNGVVRTLSYNPDGSIASVA